MRKGRKRVLTDEQREANRRKQLLQQREVHRSHELGVEDLRLFEDRFSSDTVAADSRGSFRLHTNLGEGCRWVRYKRII